MSSPYVRQRRLSDELAKLLRDHGWTAERLAAATGLSKQRISRIMRCRVRPNVEEILRVLNQFNVDKDYRSLLVGITRDAQERGWWEPHAEEMGLRQAMTAGLEWGTATIHEYQLNFVPGLTQTESYTRARIAADREIYEVSFDTERVVEARRTRQLLLDQRDGPAYEVVIDELALRRPAAPVRVVASQLDHLVDLGHNHDRIDIRILPMLARIRGYAVPRSAFSIYRYPDPGDSIVVAVDSNTTDQVFVGGDEVRPYLALYQRLRDAALSPTDSLDFLAALAQTMPHEMPEQVEELDCV
ncbi:helix-turn-helix domain-containing protein [Paractinoplanes rhizophilus]|uniref:Helix-turn-helix domain-containing protein n=1 Tax=Paractinoplanes rhizophilus TaxID=1416877 RepID=A0ABW2I439_9ACTN